MSDSDNDDLPTLSKFKFIFGGTRKKTFDELFNEASNLIQNLESEPHHLEQTEEISVQETQDDNLLINESVLDEDYDCDTFRELSVRLFGESNHLQFFTWDDLTLENCGLNATLDLSEQERVLVTLNEVELLKEIECCETFSLKKFKQLKPFVQYALKSMSIHPDEGYVRACQKFIKRTIFQWHHIKDLSISYAVIFTALFNYGVDVKTKIFNVLPGVKDVKRTEFVNEIPRDYVCNLKAVLSSISDLMKHCKMEEEDLYNILIYLLCMSLDDFVKINSHLQQCTAIILWRFSNTEWPFWRLKIAQFVLSTYTQMNNEWNSAIKMIQCITNDELRGFELRNYISYLVLVKLTDKPNSSVIPEYSKKLFRIQRLQPILESTSDIEKRLQFAAIKFINLFTNSLKLSNKEEHRKLCILLKKCETSISKHATIQQSQLCIIHSRISIMAPPESLKRVQDYVSGEEGDISEYESESDSNAILPASDELSNQSFADNDSSDMLENGNINSEDSITNESKKITEENPSSSLNEQFVDDYEMKSVCETSNEVNEPKGLVSYDANDTLKNISNESQEITEKSPPCSLNEQFIDDHKVKSVCETPFGMKDIQIALEITESNAVQCSPEKNSDDKLEIRPKRLNTESDQETDKCSESGDFAEKEMRLNFSKKNSPSKSFLINHPYSRKKQISPGSPCKKLSVLLKDIKMNEKLNLKSNSCVNTLLSLESDKSTEKCAEDPSFNGNRGHGTNSFNIQARSTDSEESNNFPSVEQTLTVHDTSKMSEVDSNSLKLVEKKSAASSPQNQLHNSNELKISKDAFEALVETESESASSSSNPSPVPNLIESAETYLQTFSLANSDVLTCAEKSEDLRKTDVLNMEVNHSPYTIISNQSQLVIQNDPAQSEKLHNITLTQNLNSHSDAENKVGSEIEQIIAQLTQQNSVSHKSSSFSPLTNNGQQNYPGILYLLPSSTPDTTECSGTSTNTSDLKNSGHKFLNVENDQNPVAVQPKDITDECQLISPPSLTLSCAVNECNQAKAETNELYSENSHSVIKQIDESTKVSTDDLTRIEDIASYTVLTDVPLSLENTEDSIIGKLNSTDDEKQEKLNEIVRKNSLELTNTVPGFSYDHHAPCADYQSITCPFKKQPQTGDSSKTRPHAVEFPNASYLKRRHTDSASLIVSKKARLSKNFPSTVPSDGNFNWQKETKKGSVDQLINNDSSSGDPTETHKLQLNTDENFRRQKETETGPVSLPKNDISSLLYYSGICNLPLTTEISSCGKRFESSIHLSNDADSKMNNSERPEVIIDHSSHTESKTDISTDFCLSDKIPAIADIDHSNNTKPKTNILNIKSDSESSNSSVSSSSQISSSTCKTKKSYSQAEVLKALNEYIESVSESEEDIQIIEEICNINRAAKITPYNTLPSDVVDKKRKDNFFKMMSQKSNHISVKTKHKKSRSSGLFKDEINNKRIQKKPHGSRSIPGPSTNASRSKKQKGDIHCFNQDEDDSEDCFILSSDDERIQKKSVRAKSRIHVKSDSSKTQKKYVNCNDLKTEKKPRLTQTSLSFEPHGSRSVPGPSTKASRSKNQSRDFHCINQDDSEDCLVISSDTDISEIIILDSDDDVD